MYLIKYDLQGKAIKIIPNPKRGLSGMYINDLPSTIDRMLETKAIVRSVDEDNKMYYEIK